jgi:hypothetical protein
MKYVQPSSSYTVIENFYPNPEAVASLAKEFPIISCGPSKTRPTYELDANYHNEFANVIIKLYGRFNPNKEYSLMSFFSKHEMHDKEMLNHGWWRTAGHNPETCRYDDVAENLVYCGIIMLSHSHLDSDFQVGKVKPHLEWTRQQFIDETCNYYSIPREKYNEGAISYEEFVECYNKHDDNYISTMTVKNEYNKFIAWHGDVVHKEKRVSDSLNQYFFLSEWDK